MEKIVPAGTGYLLAEERGKGAVARVEDVLTKLKDEGVINNFGQTTQFGDDDLFGIDFFIIFKGRMIKLQVKFSGNKKTARRYQRRGIEFIAVGKMSDQEIKQRIIQILEKQGVKKILTSFLIFQESVKIKYTKLKI